MKRQSCLLLLPLLAACATTQEQGEAPTLADLARRPAPQIESGDSATDRGRAIDRYQEFLERSDDPTLRAEAMRRLADLKLEEGEARQAAAPEAKAPQTENQRVIALYEERLKAYPYHPQNDQVLYQLSRAYENEGLPDKALEALNRLIGGHPDTPLLAEAQFRRGEMLFVQRRYPEAEQAYRAVLARGPASGFYDQSLYKRGWSLFKQSLYFEGIDLFLALIDRKAVGGRLELDRLSRADREQIEDTLRAISLSFGYLDGPETVAEYFRERGHRKDEDILYRSLGEEYLKKERYSDAAASFQAFVAAYPNTDLAPQFQLRAIEAYRKGRFPSQVLEARKAYVRLFDLGSPYWHTRKPEDQPKVVEQLQISLRDLARHYHALAQKEKQAEHYRLATDWYQRYLRNFPSAAGAQEMRFLLAELHFERKDYPAAVEQYEQVAYRYSRNGRAAEAAHAALLAYDAHGKTLQGEARLAWQRQALDSARRFAALFPRHPQAAPALAQAAQRLFELKDGGLAIAAAREVLKTPGADAGTRLTSWTIIGHTAFDDGDFLTAENAYRQALAQGQPDADARRALTDRLAASLYEQGSQRRKTGDLAGAADLFLKAAANAASPQLKATGQFDAAAAYLELEQWEQAVGVLERFRTDHPKHPRQPEVSRRLAVAYANSGRLPQAAAEYERLATLGTPELQRQALHQAAELQRKAGDLPQARRVLVSYLQRFPTPVTEALEARQQLIELAEAQGDPKEVRRWRQALVEAEAKAGAERSDRSRFLAAQASLALARELGDTCMDLRLVEPLQASLKRKRTALEQALKAYSQAADYGVAPVTTAASHAIGDLYRDFGRALLESERPSQLKGEALAEYELMLEDEAMPFEEKAIEIYELNIRRTGQGVYDQWVRSSYAALAELVPGRYAKTERREGHVDAIR